MKVIMQQKPRPRRAPLLWVLGSLVVPALVLIGFGPGLDRAVGHAPAATVAVVIGHDHIQMPDSAMAGTVAFTVTNRDNVAHDVAIKAVGAEKPLASLTDLKPGAKEEKQLTLGVGSYQVYCPAGKDDGLTHLLSVLAKPASSKNTR